MRRLLALSIVLLACGQALADGMPQHRDWINIAAPGPNGDHRVWGWRQGESVLYYEAEQPTHKPSPTAPTLPAQGATLATNYGVDISKLQEQRPGVFETNDVAFDGSKFFGTEDKREPVTPTSSAPIYVSWYQVVLVLFGGFFLLIGIVKRLE